MKIVSFLIVAVLLVLLSYPCRASLLNTICSSTPYPTYCKSTLSGNNSENVFDYGTRSLRKSLFQSQKFLNLINKYISRRWNLSIGAIRALQDCQSMAAQNTDILLHSLMAVHGTAGGLNALQAADVQTLLTALLTNLQTCQDGLRETSSSWIIQNGISAPLSNDSKLYSVSLALFTRGWVNKMKKKAHVKSLPYGDGRWVPSTAGEAKSISDNKVLLTAGSDLVKANGVYTVSQDGTGNFTTITDALEASPSNLDGSNGYFMIYIRAGVYEEYVSIGRNKTYLMLVGDGIGSTIITGNRSVVDGWTTFRSATFSVTGSHFVAVNITIRNTAGPWKHQAVALRNGADYSIFFGCSFEGYQDTLYAHSLRQFYRNCDIYGTVDFIFGNAAAVFQECNMYARLPLSDQCIAITAQSRSDPNQNSGITIQDCVIKPAGDLASSGLSFPTYLGRPWNMYSRTVYMQSFIDGFIDPSGWRDWNGTGLATTTVYYAEYNNTGPGSDLSRRVNWAGYHVLTELQANNFTASNFVLGDTWIPPSGVPYTASLY